MKKFIITILFTAPCVLLATAPDCERLLTYLVNKSDNNEIQRLIINKSGKVANDIDIINQLSTRSTTFKILSQRSSEIEHKQKLLKELFLKSGVMRTQDKIKIEVLNKIKELSKIVSNDEIKFEIELASDMIDLKSSRFYSKDLLRLDTRISDLIEEITKPTKESTPISLRQELIKITDNLSTYLDKIEKRDNELIKTMDLQNSVHRIIKETRIPKGNYEEYAKVLFSKLPEIKKKLLKIRLDQMRNQQIEIEYNHSIDKALKDLDSELEIKNKHSEYIAKKSKIIQEKDIMIQAEISSISPFFYKLLTRTKNTQNSIKDAQTTLSIFEILISKERETKDYISFLKTINNNIDKIIDVQLDLKHLNLVEDFEENIDFTMIDKASVSKKRVEELINELNTYQTDNQRLNYIHNQVKITLNDLEEYNKKHLKTKDFEILKKITDNVRFLIAEN